MITDAKMQTGRLFLTVKWYKRSDGVQAEDTVFTNSELKRHSPLLLCEFYERMLRVNIKQKDTMMPSSMDMPSTSVLTAVASETANDMEVMAKND